MVFTTPPPKKFGGVSAGILIDQHSRGGTSPYSRALERSENHAGGSGLGKGIHLVRPHLSSRRHFGRERTSPNQDCLLADPTTTATELEPLAVVMFLSSAEIFHSFTSFHIFIFPSKSFPPESSKFFNSSGGSASAKHLRLI